MMILRFLKVQTHRKVTCYWGQKKEKFQKTENSRKHPRILCWSSFSVELLPEMAPIAKLFKIFILISDPKSGSNWVKFRSWLTITSNYKKKTFPAVNS